MQVTVDFTRQAAPSFKSWKIADPSFKGFGKAANGRGMVPSSRVVLATDSQGFQWVHERIFRTGEHDKARKLQEAVEARGYIDPRHWRKADRREY